MRTATVADLEVPRIGLVAVSMSHGYTGAGSENAESIRAIHRAPEFPADITQRPAC